MGFAHGIFNLWPRTSRPLAESESFVNFPVWQLDSADVFELGEDEPWEADLGSESKSKAIRRAVSERRRVSFDPWPVMGYEITPYSEIYGMHPSTFDFDSTGMVEISMGEC